MRKNTNKESDFNSLIIRYLTNNITENEKGILFNWIASDKKNETVFNKLYKAWAISGSEKGKSDFNVQSGWNKLYKNMQTESKVKGKQGNKVFLFKYLRTAASWLVIFTLGLSIMYLLKGKSEKLASAQVIINVPLGSRSDIVLPDGSKVWLNAGTEIIYNQDYGIETRTISLCGEAYFDVARDKEHPFIVNVTGLKIRALGTRFNVKAYPEEETISATLEEGKIDVQIMRDQGKIENFVLLPYENIVIQKSDQALTKADPKESVTPVRENTFKEVDKIAISEITVAKSVNTALYSSWKDEKWIIESKPLGELAPMLERRYNVKIVFNEDILKHYNFTGTIQNETTEQIMSAITMTAPVKYWIEEDVVTLTSNPVMIEKYKQITKQTGK